MWVDGAGRVCLCAVWSPASLSPSPPTHTHTTAPLHQAVAVAFCMTFFEFFDVPVYWPILLLYFLSLFILTMKRQIRHMIKHR